MPTPAELRALLELADWSDPTHPATERLTDALPALLDAVDIVRDLGTKPAPTNDYPMSTRGRWGCTLCSGMAHEEDDIVHDDSCVWLRSRAALAKLEMP